MATKKKTTKRVLRRKYDTVTIYYGDGEYWTFKLTEWTLYRDFDCIEIVKNDKTQMEVFLVPNVTRLSFSMSSVKQGTTQDNKILSMKKDVSGLDPVA